MDDKQRILNLIENGVLSTQEGLKLLERLAKESSIKDFSDSQNLENSSNQKKNEADEQIESEQVEPDSETETHDDASNLSDAFSDIGSAFKSFGSGIKSAFSAVKDGVDFKEVTIPVPKLASVSFEKTVSYPDLKPVNLEVENVNGNLILKKSLDDLLKIEVNGKIYGDRKVSATEYFEKEAIVQVSDQKIVIKATSMLMVANFTIFLPELSYQLFKLKGVNGNFKANDLQVYDIKVASKNGNFIFTDCQIEDLQATTFNGNINLIDSASNKNVLKTTNGDIGFTGDFQEMMLNTVNGDLKVVTSSSKPQKITANNINGKIKLAIPEQLSAEGELQSTFGEVKTKLSQLENFESRKNALSFKREVASCDHHVIIEAKSTTGNIYLKDNFES